MNYSIIPTTTFVRELKTLLKKYRSLKDDLVSFEQELLKNPYIGDDLGGNVRKIRIAITSKNKGKRGGARIITYNLIVNVEDAEVYLLSIYDKSQKTNISAQEIEQIKQNHGLT